jgi:hypothetical protein
VSPHVSIELVYPAELIIFFLLPRVEAWICFLGRVVERLWIRFGLDCLALAFVEQLDHWLIGRLGRNRKVVPEKNGTLDLNALMSIEIYVKQSSYSCDRKAKSTNGRFIFDHWPGLIALLRPFKERAKHLQD